MTLNYEIRPATKRRAMNDQAFIDLAKEVDNYGARLITVSKTRSIEEIQKLYDHGQRDFGENKVQEWVDKRGQLPDDIRWHLIGHLQTNKVKYLDPVPYLIHSLDRKKLLKELDKTGRAAGKNFNVLLQIKIAAEDSKFGFDWEELFVMAKEGVFAQYPNVNVRGVMGMATFTENLSQVREEFRELRGYFEQLLPYFDTEVFTEVSMGMSGDYKIALEEGSTMIRVGTLIFGPRNYQH